MNLAKIENTLKAIKQVEKTHKGLGLVVDFILTNAFAKNGLILCGEYESGKSASALAVHGYLDYSKKILGTKTLYALGGENSQNFQKDMSNSFVYWTAEDLVQASDITLNNTLKVVCTLLDKHEIHYDVKGSFVKIENCYLSFVGCATFDVLQTLFKTREWIGNYAQRLMRYYVLPFLPFDAKKDNPSWTLNPKPFYEPISKVELDKTDKNYKDGLKLFNSQFEPKRAKINYENWLCGHALFNHRLKVEPEDYEILLLSYPNIRFEKWFAKRIKPSEPKIYDLDSAMLFAYCLKNQYQFGQLNTIDEIIEKFDLSEKTTRTLLSQNTFLDVFTLTHNQYAYLPNPRIWEYFKLQKDFIELCIKN